MVRRRFLLQVGDQIRSRFRLSDAPERHVIARNEFRRVGEPGVEGLVIPDDIRGLESGRIPLEVMCAAGLPAEQTGKAWTGHVLARLEGMACRAGSIDLGTLRGVAF